MLKNKGIVFVLLLLVGYVWFQVFYRIKDNFFSKNNAPFKIEKNNSERNFSIERDTTPLLLGYSDPFSAHVSIGNTNSSKEKSPSDYVPKPTVEKYIIWPEIQYFGFLKSSQSKEPLAILKINGEFYYVRKGETILDGLIVKNVSKECIWIKYTAETKKICL